MLKRIASAVVGIPFICLITYLGGWYFKIVVLLLGLIGFIEFINAVKIKKSSTMTHISILLSAALLILTPKGSNIEVILVCFIITGGILTVTDHNAYTEKDLALTAFGIVYVPFMLSHLTMLRNVSGSGLSLIWLCFICTWSSDSFAYFAGRFLGKHKISPTVSPNKTIEGCIGGLLGSVIMCIIWAHISKEYLHTNIEYMYIKYIIVGVIGGIISQFGDLTASSIKRYVGIKDYGNLIPGHGGIVDRFDSLIFVAPFVYYFITMVKF